MIHSSVYLFQAFGAGSFSHVLAQLFVIGEDIRQANHDDHAEASGIYQWNKPPRRWNQIATDAD